MLLLLSGRQSSGGRVSTPPNRISPKPRQTDSCLRASQRQSVCVGTLAQQADVPHFHHFFSTFSHDITPDWLELMLRYILYLWVCRFLFPRLIAPHVSVCQHTLAVYAHVICSNQFSSISSRLSAAVFMGNILKKQEKLKQLPAKKCLWIGEIWMDLPNSKMYKDTRSTINSSV